jgi:putative transposase
MTNVRERLYHRHRFPAEIIAEAVWLYFRFPLSFRMVEDMLAYKGMIVTHKTIRQWAEKFGRNYASNIRRRTPRLGDKCWGCLIARGVSSILMLKRHCRVHGCLRGRH